MLSILIFTIQSQEPEGIMNLTKEENVKEDSVDTIDFQLFP